MENDVVSVWHASFDPVDRFTPRVPESTCPGEDTKIPRICVAPSVAWAIKSIPGIGKAITNLTKYKIPYVIYVYEIKTEKGFLAPDQLVWECVPDTRQTKEKWLLREPVFIKKNTVKLISPLVCDDGRLATCIPETVEYADNWKLFCKFFNIPYNETESLRNDITYRTLAQNLDLFDKYLIKRKYNLCESDADADMADADFKKKVEEEAT